MTVEPAVIRRPLGDRARTAILYYGASCLETLRCLADESVHCCVTSPPYWGLRDYGTEEDQIGLEERPEKYVDNLLNVFREVRRVLRDDGTVWLNLGDSYARGRTGRDDAGRTVAKKDAWKDTMPHERRDRGIPQGLKNKDLVGIPWMVAFALRADGWYLRSDIVWAKSISGDTRTGTCMPESVTDRPTQSKEYVFLLSKSPTYFFDMDAVREPHTMRPQARPSGHKRGRPGPLLPEHTWSGTARNGPGIDGDLSGRNLRSVWHLNPKPYPGAHFAVFPPTLPRLCILAGTSERGCCPMCGTPWVREVERSSMKVREGPGRAGLMGASTTATSRTACTGTVTEAPVYRMLGWRPTCGCPEHEPVPCVVLDPFSGSGTTGMVALDHGRNIVGLDLNGDYLELARARILGEPVPDPHEEDDLGILNFLGVEDP